MKRLNVIFLAAALVLGFTAAAGANGLRALGQAVSGINLNIDLFPDEEGTVDGLMMTLNSDGTVQGVSLDIACDDSEGGDEAVYGSWGKVTGQGSAITIQAEAFSSGRFWVIRADGSWTRYFDNHGGVDTSGTWEPCDV